MKNLNGYRIKVTPDTKDEIEALIRNKGYDITETECSLYDWLIYNQYGSRFFYGAEGCTIYQQTKQMYLHNHELVFDNTCASCKYAYNSADGYWCNAGVASTGGNAHDYTCEAWTINHLLKEKNLVVEEPKEDVKSKFCMNRKCSTFCYQTQKGCEFIDDAFNYKFCPYCGEPLTTQIEKE